MEFWLALLVFMLSHILIARGRLRPFLVARIGEKLYLTVYSILSLALLAWLISAAISVARIPLWPLFPWLYWIPNIFMPLALMLLAAGFIVPSPLSIAPRDKGFDAAMPPFWIAVTRHPVLWGFFLWAASHIPPNGEYPLVFMFALFAAFAMAGIKLIDRKRKRQLGENNWSSLSQNTPSILFAGRALWRRQWRFTWYDLFASFSGLLAWAALYHLHGTWFGIIPLPPIP